MFTVIARNGETERVVYAVREQRQEIEFLIFCDRWEWMPARLYMPLLPKK